MRSSFLSDYDTCGATWHLAGSPRLSGFWGPQGASVSVLRGSVAVWAVFAGQCQRLCERSQRRQGYRILLLGREMELLKEPAKRGDSMNRTKRPNAPRPTNMSS